MQSRQAIMEEIRKTIARSERLYETAKAQHRGTIERALSGSGLGDVQKRSLTKTIAPANTGFRKGGVAANFIGNDSDGGVTHLPEQDYLHSSPKAADDLTDYFHTEDGSSSSDPISPVKLPVQSHADGEEDGDAFRAALLAQYPMHEQMVNGMAKPAPSASFEARYMQNSGIKLEPTTGPAVHMGPVPESDLPSKANLSVLQKLDYIFKEFMEGGSLKLAKVHLGIR